MLPKSLGLTVGLLEIQLIFKIGRCGIVISTKTSENSMFFIFYSDNPIPVQMLQIACINVRSQKSVAPKMAVAQTNNQCANRE